MFGQKQRHHFLPLFRSVGKKFGAKINWGSFISLEGLSCRVFLLVANKRGNKWSSLLEEWVSHWQMALWMGTKKQKSDISRTSFSTFLAPSLFQDLGSGLTEKRETLIRGLIFLELVTWSWSYKNSSVEFVSLLEYWPIREAKNGHMTDLIGQISVQSQIQRWNFVYKVGSWLWRTQLLAAF